MTGKWQLILVTNHTNMLPECRRHTLLARYSFLLAMAIVSATCSAQPVVEFSGYVVDFPIYQRATPFVALLSDTEQDQFLNMVRLRLRPTVQLWDGAFLALEHEVSALYRSTAQYVAESSTRRRGQLLDLAWNPVNRENVSVTHFVDRLFLRQTSDVGDFTVGRQRISWGTGRVWNPTDLFNPINPATFSKIEKDGVDALSAKFHLGNFTDVHVVINPENDWNTVNTAVRFRTNEKEFDISLMAGQFAQRIVLGGDFAGNAFDAGVRGEVIVSQDRENRASRFVKYIVGVDYQFTAELYAVMEYLHNGEGGSTREQYDLMRLLTGEILNLARDYLAATGSYMIHPLVTSSVTLTANLNDGGRFVSGVVTYLAGDEFTITCGGQVFSGGEFSEYWYYPNSVYLKVDLFF